MAVNGIDGAKYLLTRIGNSYDDEDCVHAVVINLIRNCPGGDKTYRTAGCTELWNSRTKYSPGNKYRHITECLTLDEAMSGGLLIGDLPVIFDDETMKCEHIAYYMGGVGGYECVHSSKSKGCVCGTTLKNGFTHVLRHRDITGIPASEIDDYAGSVAGSDSHDMTTDENQPYEENAMSIMHYARVATQGGALNLRTSAKKGDNIICEIPYGTEVTVLGSASTGWTKVQYAEMTGYVSSQYLAYSRPASTPEATPDDDGDGKITGQSTSLFSGTWGIFVPCSTKGAANTLIKHFSDECKVVKLRLDD